MMEKRLMNGAGDWNEKNLRMRIIEASDLCNIDTRDKMNIENVRLYVSNGRQ
jgi:hypothetical protein